MLDVLAAPDCLFFLFDYFVVTKKNCTSVMHRTWRCIVDVFLTSPLNVIFLQDLKCFVFSLINLHFKIKPIQS